MPGMDDFHAFKSTSGGLGRSVCSGGLFTWILVIVAVLWVIGKISG